MSLLRIRELRIQSSKIFGEYLVPISPRLTYNLLIGIPSACNSHRAKTKLLVDENEAYLAQLHVLNDTIHRLE